MSRSHRSLKLLNNASLNVNNKLVLNTEFDNTFVAGDLVWIVGGYYDNTNNILYSEQWTSVDNIFNNSNKKPYKILSVNSNDNSFTIDLTISGTLYYPYCNKYNTTNNIADPTDNSDLAYNNIDIINGVYDMYKGVYVSQYVAPKPRIIKSIINNGIFGTDNTIVNIGVNSIFYNNDLRHGAFKNVYINASTINNKSYNSGLITRKLIIDQDLQLINISLLPDNNNQGYSAFEKAELISCILNRSEIENPRENFIKAIDLGVISGVIGSDSVIEKGANSVTLTCANNDAYIKNVTFNNLMGTSEIAAGNIIGSSKINLYSTTINHVTLISSNTIRFSNVSNIFGMYNTLKPFTTSIGYINGFVGNDNKTLELLNGKCKIVTNTYTYGLPNSATIDITFDNLLDPVKQLEFVNDYTNGSGIINSINLINSLNNIVLYYNDSTLLESYCTISSQNILNIDAIANNNYFETDLLGSVINITGGFYDNISLYNNINITASLNKPVYLTDCYQLTLNNFTPIFNYVIINSDYTYSANFNNSKLYSGNYSNSEFTNSIITSTKIEHILLYNCTINDYTYVDVNVDWEYIKYNTTNSIAGYYQLVGGYYKYVRNNNFAGRTFQVVCANSANIPMTLNSPIWNMNNKKTVNVSNYINGDDTQAIGYKNSDNKIYAKPIIDHNIVFPTNLLSPVAGSNYNYALYDLGTLKDAYPNFLPNNNRNKLLYVKNPSVNSLFNNVLNNVITNNITTNDTYLVLSDSAGYTVDASQVYSELYFKNNPSLSRANTMATIFENPTKQSGFPIVTDLNMYVQLTSGGPNILVTPYNGTIGSINILPLDDYEFFLEALAWSNIAKTIAATKVPSCYIEIEYTKIEDWNNAPPSNNNIVNFAFNNTSFTFNDDNSENTSINWANPSTPFTYPTISPLYMIRNIGTYAVRVEISVWITEHFNNRYENCGKKTHHILEYWFDKV